jgi:hypothetical protein
MRSGRSRRTSAPWRFQLGSALGLALTVRVVQLLTRRTGSFGTWSGERVPEATGRRPGAEYPLS